MPRFAYLSCAALCVAGAMSLPAYADKSIPVADFFKKAQFSGRPVLSPDGQTMAVLVPRNGRFALAVIPLSSRQPKVVAGDVDWDIVSPRWVNNQRLCSALVAAAMW